MPCSNRPNADPFPPLTPQEKRKFEKIVKIMRESDEDDAAFAERLNDVRQGLDTITTTDNRFHLL